MFLTSYFPFLAIGTLFAMSRSLKSVVLAVNLRLQFQTFLKVKPIKVRGHVPATCQPPDRIFMLVRKFTFTNGIMSITRLSGLIVF